MCRRDAPLTAPSHRGHAPPPRTGSRRSHLGRGGTALTVKPLRVASGAHITGVSYRDAAELSLTWAESGVARRGLNSTVSFHQ